MAAKAVRVDLSLLLGSGRGAGYLRWLVERGETNKNVGMLFPQNTDGETWGNNDYGLPVPTQKAGYKITGPGFFQPRATHYSAPIAAFKDSGCDIRGGITYPDAFKDLVNQCARQACMPKAMKVAAALLFPGGDRVTGRSERRYVIRALVDPGFPGQIHPDRRSQPRQHAVHSRPCCPICRYSGIVGH